MMNSKKFSAILLTILFIISFSAFAATNTKTEALPSLTKTDSNVYTEDKLSITVPPNQPTFVIKLKSNPTTGYSWFLREYDQNILMPVSQQFEKPTQELMGASGFEIWTFKVKPAGFVVPQQTIIRMVYAR